MSSCSTTKTIASEADLTSTRYSAAAASVNMIRPRYDTIAAYELLRMFRLLELHVDVAWSATGVSYKRWMLKNQLNIRSLIFNFPVKEPHE